MKSPTFFSLGLVKGCYNICSGWGHSQGQWSFCGCIIARQGLYDWRRSTGGSGAGDRSTKVCLMDFSLCPCAHHASGPEKSGQEPHRNLFIGNAYPTDAISSSSQVLHMISYIVLLAGFYSWLKEFKSLKLSSLLHYGLLEVILAKFRVLLGGGHANSTGSVFSWGFLNEGIHCPWTHVAVTTCLIAYVPKVIIKVTSCTSQTSTLRVQHWKLRSTRFEACLRSWCHAALVSSKSSHSTSISMFIMPACLFAAGTSDLEDVSRAVDRMSWNLKWCNTDFDKLDDHF